MLTNWNAVAAIAAVAAATFTAVGVWATVWMVMSAARQTRTEWEDDLNREYREIASKLPVAVRLGQEVGEGDIESRLSEFLNYFDLSNQQALLRKSGRISRSTWKEWREGLKTSFEPGPFLSAWTMIQRRNPKLFSELKELQETKFEADPPRWKRLALW